MWLCVLCGLCDYFAILLPASYSNMADDRRPTPNDEAGKKREEGERRSFMLQMAHYSHLAFVLPAATFIGWIIGALLDRWLHTTWLYLAGLLLGIVAGFVDLIRTALSAEKDSEP